MRATGERVQITGLQGAAQHNGRIGTVSIGCEVTLTGLQSAEHNGKEGVVQAFVKAKGRYTVEIKKGKHQGQGSETKGQQKKQNNMNVKAANLEQSGRYTVLLEGVEKPLRIRPCNLIPCRSSNRLPSDSTGLRRLSLVEVNAMMMALNHPLADCVLTGRGPCEPWLRRLALLELLSTPGRDLVFSATGPQMMLANRGSRVTCPDLRSIYKPVDMMNCYQSAVFGPAGHHTAIWGGRHYAEIQVLDLGLTHAGVLIGVVGEGCDPSKPGPMNRKGGEEASESDVGWMIDISGRLNHKGGALKHVGGEYPLPWAAGTEEEGNCGMGDRGYGRACEAFAPGARLGLLVDLRPHRRSVAVYKNGKRVGLVVPSGLRPPMRWAVSLFMEASVRIVKTVELPVDVSDAQHAREAKRTIELVAADESARRFGFTHPTNDSVNDDDTPAAARSPEDLARIRQVEHENIAKARAMLGWRHPSAL